MDWWEIIVINKVYRQLWFLSSNSHSMTVYREYSFINVSFSLTTFLTIVLLSGPGPQF